MYLCCFYCFSNATPALHEAALACKGCCPSLSQQSRRHPVPQVGVAHRPMIIYINALFYQGACALYILYICKIMFLSTL